jgi:hypothetical protein
VGGGVCSGVAVADGVSVSAAAADGVAVLLGLKQDLNVGDEIEIILHFKNQEDIRIKGPVQNILLPEHEGN